ncbi:lysophospholipid acyltransferase family protein [Schlesneria sp. T3-172]|uniref:lysophospholipid acyltransferase family protein n=1 Tax=Schlesneria sphaerica TaxID=3373610 RepID=UPI0037CBF4D1
MKIRSRWLTKFAALTAVATFRLLFWTCRKKFLGDVLEQRMDPTVNDEHFVLSVWHDALLLPTFAAPKWLRKRCCCLVSQHQDGSYLADAMAWMDYTTVRGSSRRGGVEALRQLLTDTAGKHIIVTPDGPRGPRRVMKPGVAFIASQTGRRLLPGAFVVKNGWRVKGSWTDLVIPMPFTTIYLITGRPVSIPQDTPRSQLTQYVAAAQQAMDEINEEAERLAGRNSPQSAFPSVKAA